jgi:predicted metal-binding membrane protein
MPMMQPAMTGLMTAAMMVAMMLPSFAPSLWRYHRQARARGQTVLYAAGYVGVWTAISLSLFLISAEASPSAVGAVLLCAGALQRSRWKANQLLRCRQVCVTAPALHGAAVTAWRDGSRLGVDCVLSCAAPMAALLVVGLMDTRMMLLITAAITAERLAPSGAHIARVTGSVAVIAGLLISL